MTRTEMTEILKNIQDQKAETMGKLSDYFLPFFLTYLGIKKKKLTKLDYKILLVFGVSNILLNKDRYIKTINSFKKSPVKIPK